MIELLVVLFGLIFGSFLNVCIHRLPRDGSVVRPRSHCIHCGHQIDWYDNIPVAGFFLLGRSCRHCRASISWRYTLVELLTAAFFLLIYANWGLTPYAAKMALFVTLLEGMVFSDWETRLLPDEFTLGGLAAGMALAWFIPVQNGMAGMFVDSEGMASVFDASMGASFAAGALWLVGYLFKMVRNLEGLGFGDVKMVAMMGAFLGLSSTLLAILLACVAGSAGGLAFILLMKKDSKYELPLGSFLGIAGITVALWGSQILHWYTGL